MKYYIIAGEASGDMYGGLLIEAIKEKDKEAEFYFWGGDQMTVAADHLPHKHYKETAIMGFWEVMINIRKIISLIRDCKSHIIHVQPHVVIYIDYPGFNLRIAKWAASQQFRNVYFIAPKVWAWKEGRIKNIRKYIDRLYVILPFEVEYFKPHQVQSIYYGHPLLNIVNSYVEKPQFANNISGKKIIALLPGSRKQEISYIFPIMADYARLHPEYDFLLAQAPHLSISLFESSLKNQSIPDNIHFYEHATYDIYAKADCAIIASGTATLEAALFGLPQVVVYKGHWLSYIIAQNVVKLNFVSLVNLILKQEAVTELLQSNYNLSSLEKEMNRLFDPSVQKTIHKQYEQLKMLLEPKNAIEKIAGDVYQYLTQV